MVTNVTSLTGNGLKDWLIQRFTAVYLAIYSLFLLVFLLTHPQLQYHEWHALFQSVGMKVTTMIALLTFLLHTWIGIWTVTTDYLKSKVLRVFVQFLVVWFLLSQFIWGLMIVWGQ
ncbi:succinate dehydrogenase, hydrophobic membrane anchor protein [Legionella oakridgensis]|uniref:Succinate dehydrogenase hydrophobic membrane anchor subunit n=2 Tax=Legionella oakridgensis TaxID=29423 RepID=W0BCF7_9GAMM|nr:succinate dehydrogenase, hydrophobic membrane anchor protein [Legionella oakridgensis]AHE66104.1 succinate dehydrogenase, hydrophobic membrane anchor protein [Legionella oakridgensis ATCC 33761 = DSM 21215]ETO94167.1 succinate dehydrogenase, subunit D [Legionella oakridgensis RV-2-2007]KTD43852.1 succinate dehydrogenase, hydrophobic membrane anchor protein [Legionella oakridgensis]STY16020.1 succinate dehydrogenase, hydrophobic membrane anchor protein [Legionella longbeachae]